MEQWKWDIWEAESRAKLAELEEARAISSPIEDDSTEPTHVRAADAEGQRDTNDAQVYTARRDFSANATKEVDDYVGSLEDTTEPNTMSDIPGEHQSTTSTLDTMPLTVAGSPSAPSETSQSCTSERPVPTAGSNSSTSTKNTESTTHELSRQATTTDSSFDTATPASLTDETPTSHPSPYNASGDQHLPLSHENMTTTIANYLPTSAGSPIPATPSIPLPQLPIAAPATGGESIYRTIMNRLTALEANNTLYARYVEEQTAGVRDMLKRLGEEVGRLEGIVSLRSMIYSGEI